jgi:isopenicillin N synthase-like dioxygenase
MQVPVIDFAGFTCGAATDKNQIAQAIGAACRESGFFVLANHGLDRVITDRAFAAAAAFFDRPETEKQEISIQHSPYHRGWYGHGDEVLDGVRQPEGDYKEGLKIGRDLPLDHPMVKAGTPLHGPNQWPDRPDFKASMQAAYAACDVLSRQLMAAFALSLGLDETHFDRVLTLPMATLSPIRYPAATPDTPGLGAGAHTDFGCLTLLLQHDEAGLEIEMKNGDWLAVDCTPDLVMVNIGDMMARWTNNLYASTRHRVVNKGAGARHSMAFFFDPDAGADLSPLPGCLAPGAEPVFARASCLDHLLMKIDESFDYRKDVT